VAKERESIQDKYLREMCDKGTVARVVMVNQQQLVGKIAGFDAFTILVAAKGVQIMVYKSAVAVIGPAPSEKA